MSRRTDPQQNKETGLWFFVFDSVHPTPAGKRRQIRSSGFTTKKAAQAAMDHERQKDAALAPGAGGVLTVGMVLEQFIRTKQVAGRAPNTIEFYSWAAGLAAARWGGWPADKLTGDHLDAAYLAMLGAGRRQYRRGTGTTTTAEPMSARSVQAVHKTEKAAYALAVNRGQLLRNPAMLSTPPAMAEQLRRWWTPEQVGQFLEFAGGPLDSLPAELIDVLVDSGGRRGEVLALRWQDVDLDGGTATVTRQLVADTGTKTVTARPTKRRARSAPSAFTRPRWSSDGVVVPSRWSSG